MVDNERESNKRETSRVSTDPVFFHTQTHATRANTLTHTHTRARTDERCEIYSSTKAVAVVEQPASVIALRLKQIRED